MQQNLCTGHCLTCLNWIQRMESSGNHTHSCQSTILSMNWISLRTMDVTSAKWCCSHFWNIGRNGSKTIARTWLNGLIEAASLSTL